MPPLAPYPQHVVHEEDLKEVPGARRCLVFGLHQYYRGIAVHGPFSTSEQDEVLIDRFNAVEH